MIKIVLMVLIFLVAFGCGKDSKSETKATIKIPIKIGIEMPKVITVSDDEFREHLGEQEKTSTQRVKDENNYREIKPITLTIEQRFDETKFNISVVNSVIAKVEEYCKDTTLNKVCKIPKGSLEFSFNKQLVDELMKFVSRKRISDVNVESLIGESLYFGLIEFVRHDENSTYAYSLMMDSTDIENMFFSIKNSKPYIRTIRWSKDNRKIFYSSLVKSERTTLYYQNIPNIGEQAHLTLFNFTEMPFVGKTDIFDLSREKNSKNFLLNIKTVDIDTIYETQRFYQKHSSLQILEKNGYCSTDFYNRYPEVFFDENGIIQELYYNSTMDISHQVFDENGTIEALRYCEPFANAVNLESQRECKYEDITTWTTDSADDLLFKPFDKLYFREIWISADKGYLKDGEYFLIPPQLNVKKLTMEDVLKYRVASFVVLEGLHDTTYGFIYDKRYADMYNEIVHKQINEFKIVYAKYNNDLNLSLNKRVNRFEVVEDKYKPTIY